MAFPFPLNPVDGQTVSHVAADGTLMQATYDAAKNTWNVQRSINARTVLLSTRTAVTFPTATADGQVIMWDDTAKDWKASAITVATKNLSDVDGTVTPANGYVLVYDGPSKKYKPVPLSGGVVLYCHHCCCSGTYLCRCC